MRHTAEPVGVADRGDRIADPGARGVGDDDRRQRVRALELDDRDVVGHVVADDSRGVAAARTPTCAVIDVAPAMT